MKRKQRYPDGTITYETSEIMDKRCTRFPTRSAEQPLFLFCEFQSEDTVRMAMETGFECIRMLVPNLLKLSS